jgi:hypothetical protein
MIAITAVDDRYHPSAGLSFENLFTYHSMQVPDGFATYGNEVRN